MALSVSFWMSSWARRSSSSEIVLALRASLRWAVGIAAQVAHGDLGAFAFVLDDLDEFRRRSSVSAGIGTRDDLALGGRVQTEIAVTDGLSTLPIIGFSHG